MSGRERDEGRWRRFGVYKGFAEGEGKGDGIQGGWNREGERKSEGDSGCADPPPMFWRLDLSDNLAEHRLILC